MNFLNKKNASYPLYKTRYGNCSAQVDNGNQQHFASIVPDTAVAINGIKTYRVASFNRILEFS